MVRSDPGFGWQLGVVPNVSISIDTTGPSKDTRSVCLQFAGDNPPGSQLIQQIVLVSAKTNYSLEFKARADSLVSGGPPVIVVSDASSEVVKILGKEGEKTGELGTKETAFKITIYKWEGDGGDSKAEMTAYFKDGKLDTKFQFGLK